jgi:transposase
MRRRTNVAAVAIAPIGLEPSGCYERGVVRALLAAGYSVRRINSNKLRQFARAAGALAKNDRIDARLIADYVTVMPTRVVEHNPAVERLARPSQYADSSATSILRWKARRALSKTRYRSASLSGASPG